MDVKFTGLQPDEDTTKPGLFTSCSAVVPTLRGFKGAPAPRTAGLDALAAACKGAVVVELLDKSHRTFAGTITNIYENASGTTWTDRTRASGGAYGLATDVRWRFTQFGNVTLAAAKSDILQFSSSGAFANVGATTPKFGVIETVGQFVFGGDTSDQGSLIDGQDYGDRVWCCAKGDYTDWTPNADTECFSLRLTSTPGKVVGLRRFGDRIVAYKAQAMFLGLYQGGANTWDFQEIPGRIGAASHESIVDVGTPDNPRHIFMGYDDFYSFDGSRPVPIGLNRIKVSVFSELVKSRAEQCLALHDRINGLIYFYYPVSDTINPEKCVVYNYRSNNWGRDDRTVEAAFDYIAAGLTYDNLGSSYSTYADLPTLSYDGAFYISSFPNPAVFDTTHTVYTLDGTSASSQIVTGDYGDDQNMVFLSRVRARFFSQPATASMTNYYKQHLGDSLTTGATTTMTSSSNKFDLTREARWHRFQFDLTGDWESPGFIADLQVTGSE